MYLTASQAMTPTKAPSRRTRRQQRPLRRLSLELRSATRLMVRPQVLVPQPREVVGVAGVAEEEEEEEEEEVVVAASVRISSIRCGDQTSWSRPTLRFRAHPWCR